MAAKKVKSVKDSLAKSSGIKLNKKTQKPSKPKKASVEHLHPKAKNASSLTDNIKSRSSSVVEDSGLGKSQSLPLSQKLSVAPKRKKK